MSTELTTPPPLEELRYDLVPIAVRLADEGVPLYAIARVLKSPAEYVRAALYVAKGEGKILEMPREDWPPNSLRANRDPMQGKKMGDEDIVFNCVRLFKVTRQQASLLSVLIRRNEVSKDMMHQIIEQSRGPNKDDPTDPKMVDVIICKLRGKFKPHKIIIHTLWGAGYYLDDTSRSIIEELLGQRSATGDAAAATGLSYSG